MRYNHFEKEGMAMEKETEAIIAEVRALLANLRARGIPDDQIDNLIGEPEEGRIQMDKRGVISLPDYGDVQIYLNPMERTLYILLMRYPQGIPVDDLYLYYDELCGIYSKQTVFGDMDIVKDAVGALVDDYKTTLYTNVSRIKKKITDKLGRKAAPYIIIRENGTYSIKVSRNLVSGM